MADAKKLSDEELVSIVDYEFENAMSVEGGSISNERARAWDCYMAKPLGNEVPGSSSIVTSDVSDVVDGIIPSLLRIFTTSDNLASFDPTSKDDIEKAAQESDAVNYVFFRQNPSFLIMHTWMMDALIQKNGIVKCWWDETEEVSTENYQGLTEQELATLMDDDELEAVEQNERKETINIPVPTPMGMMTLPKEVTVYDVMFRRTYTRGCIHVAPVPPEEYRISSDANSPDPSCARMVGHEREVTRSEAIQMGFDKKLIMSLPTSNMQATTGEERRARNDRAEEQDRLAIRDPSQEKILLREGYIHVDYDGDGVSELRQVFVCENELLDQEECDRQPFHVLTPKPLPHKHFGRSVAELVMDIQKINSTLLRQALDNMYHSNQPGHAVWEQGMGDDTLDDLLTTQTGRVVRFSRPPSESWQPMAIPFTAQHAFDAIQYFDKAKRDRTGITQDSEGLSPEALKNIQQSVLSQAIDVARGKVEAIARIFAETGFKTLLMHIHELLQKHQDKNMIMELRGQIVEVNPQEWRKRYDMTVNVGLGLGTKAQNMIHLEGIFAKQQAIVQGGGLGVLIQPQNIFNTCAEMVKNANLKDPTRYFTDPGPMQIPPGGPKDDSQTQVQQGLIQVQHEKNQIAAQKAQLDQQEKMMKLQAEMATQQANHAREIERLNTDNEKVKNDFMVRMEEIRNQLTEMELKYATNVPGSRV